MHKITFHPLINSIILMLLILGGFIYYTTKKEETKAIGYVDNIILFNEFNMTKDIKQIEEKKMVKIKKTLDSLYAIYQKTSNKKSDKARLIESQLNSKSNLLKETQDNYTNVLSQKVWDRLNGYINDYATNHSMKIIFGTSGNGSIMYAQKSINLTDSILAFANKNYEGN